jgi:hypothetical protein
MFIMFTVRSAGDSDARGTGLVIEAPRCLVVRFPVCTAVPQRRLRLDDSAIFEQSERSRSKNSQDGSAACLFLARNFGQVLPRRVVLYDTNVSGRNPV